MASLGVVTALRSPALAAAVEELRRFLLAAGLRPAASVSDADVVVVCSDDDNAVTAASVVGSLRPGQSLLLLGPSLAALRAEPGLADAAGLGVGSAVPEHVVRLRPRAEGPHEIEIVDNWLTVDKCLDDVEVLATAMSGLTEHPVLTWRPATSTGCCTVGNQPGTLTTPAVQRLLLRWVRTAAGLTPEPAVRVGLLGFGAIGAEHVAALQTVAGLSLAVVCDRSAERLEAARRLAPEVRTTTDGIALVTDDAVDLVVVSTPPNTHAQWTQRALDAGKHVVVEKPFCLTTAEADELLASAERTSRTLVVYQNRRWDADFLALRRLVEDGAIGTVFHYESFVGGYQHPCNFWHSDEHTSGGALYDWGSHYIDWMLELLSGEVDYVTAGAHKLVWHDVTNADHVRVTVRFTGGAEATFIQSDLAAAMKPKWYVLGTAGAIVGSWREERLLARSATGAVSEVRLAPADLPVELAVHAADGSVTRVALAEPPAFPFHRELAEQLTIGAPMTTTALSSRRNIAVMEAATVSAREGGRPVIPR